MPEGPEVTIIALGLNKILKNKQIINLEFNSRSRYNKKSPDGFLEFINAINSIDGIFVSKVKNKGKFIYWCFNNGMVAFQTLGMSGGWYQIDKPHAGMILTYLDGTTMKKLYYNDQRRFGTIKFFSPNIAERELNSKLKTIGPDMLNDKDFTEREFISRLSNTKYKNKQLTHIITDQKVISGVGNYLRAEALYRAKLNPHRIIESLSNDELSALYKAIKFKILGSYKSGGASIEHYSDIDNKKGLFEFQMEVYKRKKDPLGNKIIGERIGKDTQTTYWCPDVQI